jgi:hypothetical protein
MLFFIVFDIKALFTTRADLDLDDVTTPGSAVFVVTDPFINGDGFIEFDFASVANVFHGLF